MRRISPLFLVPVLSIALLLAAGCGSKEPVPVNPEAVRQSLLNKKWFCKNIFQRDVKGESPLTLEFKDDGTVSGNGGCNDFTGPYTLAEHDLTIGPLAATKKFCGSAADEQEYTYMTFLAKIIRLKVEDDELELYMEGQPDPMVFTTSEGGFSLW